MEEEVGVVVVVTEVGAVEVVMVEEVAEETKPS